MPRENEVLLRIENNIATLTLNRPNKGNALTATMNDLLLTYLSQLEKNPQVRVVVVTGAGKYFCTGMDLSIAATSSTLEHAKVSFTKAAAVFDALHRFCKPIIARINGPCLGGGVGFIFTTDIRVAHKDVYFALTEVKRGIIPAIVSQYIVPELGPQRSKEYMLTGRRVDVQEMGSAVSSIATTMQELDEQVGEYSHMLLESAPGAMSEIKRLIETVSTGNEQGRTSRVRDGIEKAYLKMMQSKEGVYGIRSFVNKKKPDWSEFVKNNAKL